MGKSGPRERADRGEKGAGPRGLLGQEGKGWVGPSAGKREGVGLGPGVWAVGLVTGPRWFGVWAPFLIPFLFYFFSFLSLNQTKFEFNYKFELKPHSNN